MVGGLTFSDGNPSWLLERDGLQGWFDGAPVRGEDAPRPARHGSFAIPATRGGRIVSLNVAAACASPEEAEDARDTIAGVLAGGEFGDFAVTSNAGRTTSASVRLNSKPLISWTPWSNTVRAQLEFWSPDPLRYGTASTLETGFPALVGGLEFDLFTDGSTDTGFLEFGAMSSTGRVVASNQGTAPVSPQFAITGPVPPFQIVEVESGRRLVFSRPVNAGDSLVIDAATGVVVLNGGDVDFSGYLTTAEWPTIPARGTSTFAFLPIDGTGSGTLAVTWRPAWW